MKEIPLTKGFVANVDDDDYDELSKYKWCATVASERHVYAMRRLHGQKKMVSMHRSLMNPPPDMIVDHINGNTLDNRRSNLRIVTPAQSTHNTASTQKKTKGVRQLTTGRYRYTISARFMGRDVCAHGFITEQEALIFYDRLVERLYGEYGVTNYPSEICKRSINAASDSEKAE